MPLTTISESDSSKCFLYMFTTPRPGWFLALSASFLATHNYSLTFLEPAIKIKLPNIAEINAAHNKPTLA